jgi:hypothetical protein
MGVGIGDSIRKTESDNPTNHDGFERMECESKWLVYRTAHDLFKQIESGQGKRGLAMPDRNARAKPRERFFDVSGSERFFDVSGNSLLLPFRFSHKHGEKLTQRRKDAKSDLLYIKLHFLCAFAPLREFLISTGSVENYHFLLQEISHSGTCI